MLPQSVFPFNFHFVLSEDNTLQHFSILSSFFLRSFLFFMVIGVIAWDNCKNKKQIWWKLRIIFSQQHVPLLLCVNASFNFSYMTAERVAVITCSADSWPVCNILNRQQRWQAAAEGDTASGLIASAGCRGDTQAVRLPSDSFETCSG